MRTILSVALAAVVAAVPACTGGEPCDTATGIPLREMPDVDMRVGDTMEIPLKGHFSLPPGCVASAPEDTIFETTSANPAAVAVSMAEITTLEIAALEVADSVRVTVGAIFFAPDGDGHEFLVRVRAR